MPEPVHPNASFLASNSELPRERADFWITYMLAKYFATVVTAIMVLCIMNVLLGIFCQCAIDTATSDTEKVIQLQLQEKANFVGTLEDLFADWDDSGDGICSLEEFKNHLDDAKTRALLNALNIEERDALALFELMDQDCSGEVDLGEFVEGCITVRGSAKAIHMEKVVTSTRMLHDHVDELDRKIDHLIQMIRK